MWRITVVSKTGIKVGISLKVEMTQTCNNLPILLLIWFLDAIVTWILWIRDQMVPPHYASNNDLQSCNFYHKVVISYYQLFASYCFHNIIISEKKFKKIIILLLWIFFSLGEKAVWFRKFSFRRNMKVCSLHLSVFYLTSLSCSFVTLLYM